MRKLLLPVAFLVAAVTACSEQAPTEALLSGTDLSAAQKVVDNSGTIQFTQLFFNPCEGELVDLEGTIRFRVKVWDNGHAETHTNVKVHGVGQDTGVKYTGAQQFTRSFGPGGLPGVVEATLQLISATDVDNLFLTMRFHVNENGEFTVAEPTSAECRG